MSTHFGVGELCDECETRVSTDPEDAAIQIYPDEGYSSTVTRKCADGVRRQFTIRWFPCEEHKSIFFRTKVMLIPAAEALRQEQERRTR